MRFVVSFGVLAIEHNRLEGAVFLLVFLFFRSFNT